MKLKPPPTHPHTPASSYPTSPAESTFFLELEEEEAEAQVEEEVEWTFVGKKFKFRYHMSLVSWWFKMEQQIVCL